MMKYGAERRLTWGEANSGFVGKSEVMTWPVNRWDDIIQIVTTVEWDIVG